MAQAFCILGMHRSGTSLVAQLLARLGVDFGPRRELLDADADNPKGYWEIERVVHANEWILQSLGRRWDTAFPLPRGWHASPELRHHRAHVRKVLGELFAGRERFGWKDPRCCLTLPLWRNALEQAGTPVHCVLVLRNPLDVARSLARRNDFAVANGLGLWYHYTLQCLVDSVGAPRVAVRYQDLLSQPLQEATRLAGALSLDNSKIQTAVEETIDPALCHSRSDTEDLAEEASELVVGLYDRLVSTLRGNVSWQDMDREAGERLRDLQRYAAVLQHDRERQVRESSRVEQLENQLRTFRTRLARAEEMERELEGIYTSTWWQMADRYWRLRRRLSRLADRWFRRFRRDPDGSGSAGAPPGVSD